LNAAIDASILIYIFDEDAPAPTSTTTGKPVPFCRERVEHLIETLQRDKVKIIVPTPALAEALVRAQEGAPERLRLLGSNKHIRIAPFDQKAAVEYAAVQAGRIASGQRPLGTPRAKAKFDEQIIAIAAAENATVIYSDDADIKKGAGSRFRVVGIEELPLPPENEQPTLFDQKPADDETDEDHSGED